MGARGPKPEPAAIKRAKGNPGRRPIHEAAGDQAAGATAKVRVSPPAWLDTSGSVKTPAARRLSKLTLEIWHRAYPLADQLNLLRPTDIDPFARWCRYLAEWVEHTRTIDREGATYETTSPHVEKMVRLHPAAHLRRQAEQALKDLEDRLGFTPAARLRLFQQLAAHQASLPGLEQPPRDNQRPRGGEAAADDAEWANASPLGFLAGSRPN